MRQKLARVYLNKRALFLHRGFSDLTDFLEALKVVYGACKLSYPPILFCGKNGIGKTVAFNELKKLLSNTELVGNIDYGGLKKAFANGTLENTESIMLSDLQNVLGRKHSVRNSTLSTFSDLVDKDMKQIDIDFQTQELQLMKNMKAYHKMNAVIACTPKHIDILKRSEQYDFLTRFALLKVERDYEREVKTPSFVLPFTFDNNFKINLVEDYKFNNNNPRYAKIKRYLYSIAIAMKIQRLTVYVYEVDNNSFQPMVIDTTEHALGELENKEVMI